MALINGIIPSAKFEIIRDRLGEILATEYANQAALANDTSLNPAVYIERFIQIDQTETPLVNVSMQSGDYDNKSIKKVDGNYTYYIDIYTSAKSTKEQDGDSISVLKLQRLMAVTRAIIENPRYKTLGYQAPFNCNIGVTSMQVSDPINNGDGCHFAIGRLIVSIRVPETVELIDDAPLLSVSLTQVKLYNTDKGYRYEWGSVNSFTVSAGNNFTLPPQYTGLTVRLVSDDTQTYNTSEFTQVNDTVTMSSVTFTAGQKVTVTLVVNDYTANITVSASGASFTLPEAYSGKEVQIINDGTQSYTSDGFTQSGLTITMTNGVTFSAGQVVTIWYGLQLVTVTATSGDSFILPSIYRNHEQALVFDGTQSYDNTQFDEPKVITTMTNGVTFSDGQQLIIAVR